jgi:hypothetical protein
MSRRKGVRAERFSKSKQNGFLGEFQDNSTPLEVARMGGIGPLSPGTKPTVPDLGPLWLSRAHPIIVHPNNRMATFKFSIGNAFSFFSTWQLECHRN